MIHFSWPWILLLLPLPWVLKRRIQPSNTVNGLALPFSARLVACLAQSPHSSQQPLGFLSGLCWLLLLLAAARPYMIMAPTDIQVSGRDMMVVLDLSESMLIEDFELNHQPVTRIETARQLLTDFIKQREGDRVGLILFADNAYLQAPVTYDLKTVQVFLAEAVVGLAGRLTAIGDAVGLGIKQLLSLPASQRVMILVTDGANTAGQLTPLAAAEIAQSKQVKIYTIGMESEEKVTQTIFGQRYTQSTTDLDEATLENMATMTGGQYFRATKTDTLTDILQTIDTLETNEQAGQYFQREIALFMWPLGLFLFGILVIYLRQWMVRR